MGTHPVAFRELSVCSMHTVAVGDFFFPVNVLVERKSGSAPVVVVIY